MVIERVDISVVAGQEAEFEAAMVRGCAVLAGGAGCSAVSLARCVERPARYQLEVRWESIEHHKAFAATDDIKAFREIAGPFFSERPLMEHYQQVLPADGR